MLGIVALATLAFRPGFFPRAPQPQLTAPVPPPAARRPVAAPVFFSPRTEADVVEPRRDRLAESAAPRPGLLAVVAPVLPRAARPPEDSGLALPVAATVPDPNWQLTAAQLATYSELSLEFLGAAEASPGEAVTTGPRERWQAARRAADERFELLLGAELFSEQRNRALAGEAAASLRTN